MHQLYTQTSCSASESSMLYIPCASAQLEGRPGRPCSMQPACLPAAVHTSSAACTHCSSTSTHAQPALQHHVHRPHLQWLGLQATCLHRPHAYTGHRPTQATCLHRPQAYTSHRDRPHAYTSHMPTQATGLHKPQRLYFFPSGWRRSHAQPTAHIEVPDARSVLLATQHHS